MLDTGHRALSEVILALFSSFLISLSLICVFLQACEAVSLLTEAACGKAGRTSHSHRALQTQGAVMLRAGSLLTIEAVATKNCTASLTLSAALLMHKGR